MLTKETLRRYADRVRLLRVRCARCGNGHKDHGAVFGGAKFEVPGKLADAYLLAAENFLE
jgi:hypothetical protein